MLNTKLSIRKLNCYENTSDRQLEHFYNIKSTFEGGKNLVHLLYDLTTDISI